MLGGTFDPIHVGHLVAASEVADVLGLTRVVFVPAGRPWQKGGRDVAPAEVRLEMTRLAIRTDPRFESSAVDIDRPGPTYTVDTLTDLRAAGPDDAQWFFIAGADALSTLPTWHEPERLRSLATLVAVTRPGHASHSLPDGVVVVEIPGIGISSSDLRRRAAQGRPLTYLVPAAVEEFIAVRGLYRTGGRDG